MTIIMKTCRALVTKIEDGGYRYWCVLLEDCENFVMILPLQFYLNI